MKGSNLAGEGSNQKFEPLGQVRTLSKVQSDNQLAKTEVWLSVREGSNLLSVSEAAIRKAVSCGRISAQWTVGNGGRQREILLTSLPLDAQKKYWTSRGVLQSVSRPELNPKATHISGKAERVAMLRFSLVEHYRAALRQAQFGDLLDAKNDFIQAYTSGAYPALLEALGEVSWQTLDRWIKVLSENSNDAFALAPRWERQVKKVWSPSPVSETIHRAVSATESEILVRYECSPNCLRRAEVIRLFRKECDEKGLAVAVSDKTLSRYLDDWRRLNFDMHVFEREGRKALNDRNTPYLERDYSLIEVGDVVTADGHTLNFEVLNPLTGKAKRMTLVALYDMKSSCVLGWEIMPTENVRAIASAYRRGLLMLGFIPRVFLLDNGKAFRSNFFTKNSSETEFDDAFKGLFARLGTDVQFAQSYHGQTKTIERFFGTFSEAERRAITYSGTDIDHKPARSKRGEVVHRQLYERVTGGAVMTLQQAHAAVFEWVNEYHTRPQQTGHLAGRTPAEVFTESVAKVEAQAEFMKRKVDAASLQYLMMTAEMRTLYRNGIQFSGGFYYDEKFFRFEKGEGTRTRFVIRYDIADLSKIYVYTPEGDFVSEAERRSLVHPQAHRLGSQADREKFDAAINVQKRLVAGTESIAKAHLSQGLPERAALPATGTDGAEATGESESEAAYIARAVKKYPLFGGYYKDQSGAESGESEA